MLKFMKNTIFCDWWTEELADELANREEEYKVIFYNLKNILRHFILMKVLANLDDKTAYGQIRGDSEQ